MGTRLELSLYYNESSSFLFVNTTKVYQFKAKNLEIKGYALFLGNISKDFTINNVTKTKLKENLEIYYLIKENCHNCRNSSDKGMELGPVNNFGKRDRKTSKKLMMMSYQRIVNSLSFFQFMANLEPSVSWIPDA